jgi:hypothetical protein
MTKEIIIKVRINEETQRVAFIVEKNGEGSVTDILELIGVLDLIKKAQLEKVGEVLKMRG